jgi:transcriptional regulator with XRE-family HTH domain
MTNTPNTEATFGQSIRILRQARGWSQGDLAEAMRSSGFDWQQSTASKTEQATRPVRLNEAAALAALFRVPLAVMVQPVQSDVERYAETRRLLDSAIEERDAAALDIHHLERQLATLADRLGIEIGAMANELRQGDYDALDNERGE